MVNAKTIWETYNKQRLSYCRDAWKYRKDYTISRIYTKVYTIKADSVKKGDKTPSTQLGGKIEKKTININLAGLNKSKEQKSNVQNKPKAFTILAGTKKKVPQSSKVIQSSSSKESSAKEKGPKMESSSKLSNSIAEENISRSSRWDLNPENVKVDPPKTTPPVKSSKPDLAEVAARIARNLRLKELKRQMEKQQIVIPTAAQISAKSANQPQILTPTLSQVQPPAMPMVPEQPMVPNFAYQARAQAMAALQAQQLAQTVQAQSMITVPSLTHPLLRTSPWDAVTSNMMRMPIIPDNIVGVPDVLGIPVGPGRQNQISRNIPRTSNVRGRNNFNPDEFEPPTFATKETTQSKSKRPGSRDSVSPPPGVDLEEYLREHKGKCVFKGSRILSRIENYICIKHTEHCFVGIQGAIFHHY